MEWIRYRISYVRDNGLTGVRTFKTQEEAEKFYAERMEKIELNEREGLWPRMDKVVTTVIKEGSAE